MKIPDSFSPTTKFFDVDGLPATWDIKGEMPVPMTWRGSPVPRPMADGTRLLKDGVEIDEASFRAKLKA